MVELSAVAASSNPERQQTKTSLRQTNANFKNLNSSKKTATPSTVATASTNDVTMQSSFAGLTKENDGSTVNMTTPCNNSGQHTKEIIARWKREKLEQQQRPMRDLTNNSSSLDQLCQFDDSNFEMDSLVKQQLEVTAVDNVGRNDDNCMVSDYVDNDDGADDDTMDHASSVMTTPTTNTALNPQGLDRLFNRNINGKTGVRLFSNPQRVSSESLLDVSLITQDTDLMFNLQSADIDGILDQVHDEKNSRNSKQRQGRDASCTISSYQPSAVKKMNKRFVSSLDSRGQNSEHLLYTLKSKLDDSRVTMLEQEERISKQNEDLTSLAEDNKALMKEIEEYRVKLKGNNSLLFKHMQSLQLSLGWSENQGVDALKSEPNDFNDVLDIMKCLVEEQVPTLTNSLRSKQEELKSVQTLLTGKEEELENTLKSIESSKQVESELQLTITTLNGTISSKQAELSEIKCLCDERVQSAHDTERKANLLLFEVNRKTGELNRMERIFRTERDEFEGDRVAWEAQIQLKHEEVENEANKVEEDKKEIILLSDSLDSNRQELEQQRENLISLQNQLTTMEASLEEKQNAFTLEVNDFDKKKSDLEVQLHELRVAEEELTKSCALFANERKEFEEEREEFLEELDAFEKEKMEYEEERDRFMDRMSAFEKNESVLESEKQNFNHKLSQFKLTVKQAKLDAEKKRIFFNTLDDELKRKEKVLEDRIKTFLQEEDRIVKLNDDLQAQRQSFEDDRLHLDRSVSEWKDGETARREAVQKHQEAEKELNLIRTEAIRLREGINASQLELESLKTDLENIQSDISSCLKEVSERMGIQFLLIQIHYNSC